MAPTNMVTVIERCRVSPPAGSVANNSLPLTFLDLEWLNFGPVHFLLFYEFPHSRTHFIESIVPNLKHSLSLTLKHFFPLAGNLILFPSNNCKPEIRYVDGDSVSLTIAESTNDFNYLTGNYARNGDEFHPLVPQLPPVITNASDAKFFQLLAVQVTLFPNHGICCGFTMDHVGCDGITMLGFKSAWASFTKFGENGASGSLPFYDRSLIKSPNELQLDTIAASQMDKAVQHQHLPTNKFRTTFIMSRADIQGLKKLISTQRPNLVHVSAFTVVCGYVWSCIAKSRIATGEKVNDDEAEHFICGANCRALLDPPLPPNYFGNCLVACVATAKIINLIGEEGVLTAAEVLGEAIREAFQKEEGVLKGIKTWRSDFEAIKGQRTIGIAGSPKLNYYDIDFGWGKPKKLEIVSIDYAGSISLAESKESEGGVEFGLSFPKSQMDAFATIFANGLKVTRI